MDDCLYTKMAHSFIGTMPDAVREIDPTDLARLSFTIGFRAALRAMGEIAENSTSAIDATRRVDTLCVAVEVALETSGEPIN